MKNTKLKTRHYKLSLDEIEGYLMLAITLMLIIDVFLGIIARFVHFEHVFATELGKYLFIWLCLVGISAAAKDNQHIRISFIVERLPINPKITWILSQMIFLIFSLFFFYVGLRLVLMHIIMKKTTVGFDFPMYIFSAALPVGFLLTSFRLLKDIFLQVRGTGKDQWNMLQNPLNDSEEPESLKPVKTK